MIIMVSDTWLVFALKITLYGPGSGSGSVGSFQRHSLSRALSPNQESPIIQIDSPSIIQAFLCLAIPCGLWDLSSPSGIEQAHSSESAES